MDATYYLDLLCPLPQSNAVKSVKAILESLYKGSDLYAIRIAIVDLMAQQLKRGSDANNEEALPYFINALGSLTLNIDSKKGASPSGLYPCLIDLENAIAILDGARAKHTRQYIKSIEQLNYKFLIEALDAIRAAPVFIKTDK
jgi:hypothetical protein